MQGERLKTTIVDFVENAVSTPEDYKQYSFFLFERIKKHFGNNILLMDYHDKSKGGSDESFFCHALPNATKTCKTLIDNNFTRPRNRAKSFDYEDLAYAAKLEGLIKVESKEDLIIASWVAQDYQELELNLKSSDFKRICLQQDVYNKLWEFSLMVEQHLLPKKFHDESYLTSLREDFEKTANTTLCKLDVKSILSNQTWRDFFINFQKKKEFQIMTRKQTKKRRK